MSDAFTVSLGLQRIAQTLLHSLWQACTIALLAWALMTLIRRPTLRYAIGCVGLLAMLAAPLATYALLAPPAVTANAPIASPPVASRGTGTSMISAAPSPTIAPAPTVAERSRAALKSAAPWITIAWLVGVIVVGLRHTMGLVAVRRLRRRATTGFSAELRSRLARLAERMCIRRSIALLSSAAIESPCVIGWLRPAILWPASAMAGLTPSQLDAILAHELAHIRRHDYLVNLLQTLLETLGFYHPAVWWLSRRVRQEREHCCDDVAAEMVGSRCDYAAALATFESLRHEPPFAMRSNGGALVQRVQRLLVAPSRERRSPIGFSGAVISLLVALVVTGQTLRAQPSEKATTTPTFDDATLQSLAKRDLTIQRLVDRRARLSTPLRADAQDFGPNVVALNDSRTHIIAAIDGEIADRATELDRAPDGKGLTKTADEVRWLEIQKIAADSKLDVRTIDGYAELRRGSAKYYLSGKVARPGVYEMPPHGMALDQALEASGGLSLEGGMKELEDVARDNEIWFEVVGREGGGTHPAEWVARFAWSDIRAGKHKDFALLDNDTVIVTVRPRATTQPASTVLAPPSENTATTLPTVQTHRLSMTRKLQLANDEPFFGKLLEARTGLAEDLERAERMQGPNSPLVLKLKAELDVVDRNIEAVANALSKTSATQPTTDPAPPDGAVYYVAGTVEKPGVFSLNGHRVTTLQALIVAGASLTTPLDVRITRQLADGQGERTFTTHVDLQAGVSGEDLSPGDVIYVEHPTSADLLKSPAK